MNEHENALIKHLEGQKKEIDRKLAIAYKLRDGDQPANAAPAKPKAKAMRGAGFVSKVLPRLQLHGAQSSADLFAHLKQMPGMANASKASFDATLATELKKANPRIRKITPGVYAAVEVPQPTSNVVEEEEAVTQ